MERCPACRARMGGSPVCRRCGCDLTLVLAAAEEAEKALTRALWALMQGAPEEALVEVERARGLDSSGLVRCIAAFVHHYRDYLSPQRQRQGESWICRCEGWR